MTSDVYERDHLTSRTRRLTQADLRISLILTILGLTAMNLIL